MSDKLDLSFSDDETRVVSSDTNVPEQPPSGVSSIFPSTANPPSGPSLGTFSSQSSVYGNDDELEVGSILKNTYELLEELGDGGMGTVYKALNKQIYEVAQASDYLAVKVLKPKWSTNKELVKGLAFDFTRSKDLAACPNIIRVFSFDRDGPHYFMTMEYLAGQTLSAYLKRQPMSLTHAWFIIEGIGNALEYAHKYNIVHRDIKPGNIMITQEGIVKVLDFGIASTINQNDGETLFGGHDLGALTVEYAAPEVIKNASRKPEVREDVYAFSCVIYQILTGKRFYDENKLKARPIKGLTTRQLDALNKGLAYELDQRTASITELLEQLKPIKMPWLKYIGIGVFLVCIMVVSILNLGLIGQPIKTENPKPRATAIPEPTQEPPRITPIHEASPTGLATPPKPTSTPTLTPIPLDSNTGTSFDGLIYLETSKPVYKIGKPFELSFTLQQAMYVRVIDKDAKGEVTVLRPNPQQKDNVLPAGKKQTFPPKGFHIETQGSSGKCTITLIASSQPFPKKMDFLNEDGNVSDAVTNASYSWVQVHYSLTQ